MPQRTKITDPGSHLKNYRAPDQFGQWLGYEIKLMDWENQVAEGVLEIREEHLSPARKVHGGVIAAFLDYVCGVAVFTTMNPHDYCSTIELKINYLRPVDVGDKILARSEVVFRGNRLCVTQGKLFKTNQLNEPVAIVTATFNVATAKK